LRHYQNGPLVITKLKSSGRILHNTNHLKLNGVRYPKKNKKLSSNIFTMDAVANNTKLPKGKNSSCLSSPYLNKGNDMYDNFNKNYESKIESPVRFMNKTETSGLSKIKVSEVTKAQIRNQMLDLDLIKLPSIGIEDAYLGNSNAKMTHIGN
jgi:hypothetical protein